MRLKPFGDSGYQLSMMGLGLAALGRPGYINLGHGDDLGTHDVEAMKLRTEQMIDEATTLGVNYLDVAQSYGKGEAFLASWLRKNPKASVFVGSKWGYYYTADWTVDADQHEIKEHSLSRLNKQWPESHDRLASHLKLYQIHSATLESGVLENRKVLQRLFEIKQEGYLIGLSVSGEKQSEVIERALEITISGQRLFDAVQATMNCFEQGACKALEHAANAGLGVIIKEGVANGRLTIHNVLDPRLAVINTIARQHNVGIDAIALAWVMSKPFVHVVLSGASTLQQLKSNVEAHSIQLDQKGIKQLDQMRIESRDYWQERSAMIWN